MNEVISNILKRRSYRAFTEQKIEKEKLEAIMKAAVYAPTAMNDQGRKFYVIQDRAIISKLAEIIKNDFARTAYDFYKPDVLILAANRKGNSHSCEDCSCALENIFLAAESLGIGTVWINQFKNNCDKPEYRAELKKLNMPDDYVVFGACAMGYPAEGATREPVKTNTVEWF